MQSKKIVLAIIPLLSLGFAAQSGAQLMTINAFMTVDGVQNGVPIYDCNHVSGGKRYHIQAESLGLDSCGNYANHGPSRPRVATSQTGVTAALQFSGASTWGSCGDVVQHRSTIQSHIIDSSGDHLVNYPPAGPNSGCWNSNVNTGQCVSATPPITVFSSLSESGGSCANRTFHGTSAGTTP